MNKKKQITIISIIAILLLYILVWYFGQFRQYLHWKIDFYTNYGTWYAYQDEDYYDYSVILPYILEFKGGNLAIGPNIIKHPNIVIDNNGNKAYLPQSSRIIWMKPFYRGIKEIGVILMDGSCQRQVYLTNSKTALYPDDQTYVDKHQAEIEILFKKAEKMWNLEMPW